MTLAIDGLERLWNPRPDHSGQHLRPQVKSVIVSLRLKGAKIHQISKGLGVSTHTVWRVIQANRPFYFNTFFGYDNRRLPRVDRSRLIEVKISRVSRALIAWIRHFDRHGSFDLEAVLRGDKPP